MTVALHPSAHKAVADPFIALLGHEPPERLLPLVQRWANAQRTDLAGRLAHQKDRWQVAWPRWAKAWRTSPLGQRLLIGKDPVMRSLAEANERIQAMVPPLEQQVGIPDVPAQDVPGLMKKLVANPFLMRDPDNLAWAPLLHLLVTHGANPWHADTIAQHPLVYTALATGNPGLLANLPVASIVGRMHERLGNGDSLWLLCAQMAPVDQVQRLLTHGADLHATDALGNTPLHRAVQGQHLANVEVLLDAGASVLTLNGEGLSPLTLALHFATTATPDPVVLTRAQSIHQHLVKHHVARERTALLEVLNGTPSPVQERSSENTAHAGTVPPAIAPGLGEADRTPSADRSSHDPAVPENGTGAAADLPVNEPPRQSFRRRL